METVRLRLEEPADRDAVRRVNEAAFGGPVEAVIVATLHRERAAAVAMVAEAESGIVGHIMFSPVTIEGAPQVRAVGLGPMAVPPASQRRGIGSQLVEAGLQRLRHAGFDVVVVVGHPEFYPRFGFIPADTFGLRCEYDVPRDVFMALELHSGALLHAGGLVRYHRAFADA